MSTPRYRSAPPSLSGSAISVVNATTPSRPGTKSSGTAVMKRFSHPPPAGCYRSVTNGLAAAAYRWPVDFPAGDRLAAMRVEYGSVEKDGSSDLDADWLADGWLCVVAQMDYRRRRCGVAEPNAMVLATVEDGKPVSRAVLCKSVDETGVTFYTNYDSAKGADLAATPHAAVTFPVVRAGQAGAHPGAVTKVSAQETAGTGPSGRADPSWAPGRRRSPSPSGHAPICWPVSPR